MSSTIEAFLKPHQHDVGGLIVRRVLPALAVRTVGPFIFFDHIGPATLVPGVGLDVRPHPHIGLATVTYLFEGAIMHRDSVGSVQKISPGDVNWMTAGRGIVHSERTPDEERAAGQTMHGIQTWVGLPVKDEEVEPSFEHHPAAALPLIERNGVKLRVIAGSAFGETAPTTTFSPTLYVAAEFSPDSAVTLDTEHEERGVYLLQGDLTINGDALPAGQMAVLKSGFSADLRSTYGALAMLLGGAPLDGHRFIEWNFVSSSKEKIAAAKEAWSEQRMGSVPGETEFIPLPAPRREGNAPEA
ncbi:pirin domain-containing protein [Caballeronia sordidicola]|uniref:Pirin domain-containing protein n=1 Tax=Caballeronia sordidicola TaxID=196367 RepID=A0A158HU59_CABSO|nr:pirin family protein [Caballeronia sordidicola]SAL47499.1 pirin domain-containing protein [Caballeronia sordidicola]